MDRPKRNSVLTAQQIQKQLASSSMVSLEAGSNTESSSGFDSANELRSARMSPAVSSRRLSAAEIQQRLKTAVSLQSRGDTTCFLGVSPSATLRRSSDTACSPSTSGESLDSQTTTGVDTSHSSLGKRLPYHGRRASARELNVLMKSASIETAQMAESNNQLPESIRVEILVSTDATVEGSPEIARHSSLKGDDKGFSTIQRKLARRSSTKESEFNDRRHSFDSASYQSEYHHNKNDGSNGVTLLELKKEFLEGPPVSPALKVDSDFSTVSTSSIFSSASSMRKVRGILKSPCGSEQGSPQQPLFPAFSSIGCDDDDNGDGNYSPTTGRRRSKVKWFKSLISDIKKFAAD